MNTLDCIVNRRSIRNYKNEKIDRAKVINIIEYAKWAPSWNNTKAVRYIVIDNKENILEIAENLVANENINIVKNAALIFVITILKERSGYERDGSYSTAKKDGWQMFDAGTACQTLCLAATEMGIGTVILGSFDDEGVSEYVDVPKNELIIALIAAGYPEEIPQAPKRKEVRDILTFR